MRCISLVAGFALFLLSAQAQKLPDGPGKEAFEKVCAECHGLELATGQKLTKAAWTTTVASMAAKGAAGTKEEFEAIVNYLAKNFGSDGATVKVMPEGAGKQIILRECTACHPPDHFTKYQHTNEEWQAIVVRMGTRVRAATKDELETVQKYLATNYPKLEDLAKLNVNKATAKEIESRLSLAPAEAEAIVQYRERHGAFRDWGEMLAIYGVDGRKIEALKDRMSF